MKIDILTLFPEMFRGPFDESIIKRAVEKGLVEIDIHDLRKWATDKHGTVDDRPYGGGTGMIIKIDVVDRAIEELKVKDEKRKTTTKNSKIILLTPQGKVFNQGIAKEFSKLDYVILIAGHYEGFDERIREHLVDEEISIGDYVLTSGELPAMVLTDAIARLVPGVLVKEEAAIRESFENGLLEHPQYTRPDEYKGWSVPELLKSGNHKEIEEWRESQALKKTKKVRPDLVK